jgi:phosphoglycolate phosphatase-like HAD superfamily hydrolase
MKLVRAVLFDWDGTLVNSLEIKIHNAGELFHQVFQLSPDRVADAYRAFSGIPRRQLFDSILRSQDRPPLDDGTFQSLSQSFSDLNRKSINNRRLPGLIPPATPVTLDFLQKAGCLLFVSSSADMQEVREIASGLGLAEYFTGSGGDILGSRPDFSKGSQHVEYICTTTGLTREVLVFVGDDPADIQLGQAAGVFTIVRVGTHSSSQLSIYKPDAIIHSLDELISLPGLTFGYPGGT